MSDKVDDFVLARSTAYLLSRAQQAAQDRFARREPIINLRQFGVLAAIREQPGASQNDLVRATGIDRSTLADMLKRMQTQGLVERSASEVDGRANCVGLTEVGAETLIAGAEDARKADQYVLDALPKSKRKGFQDMLARLARALDEAAEKAEREERKRRKRELKRAKKLQEVKIKKPKPVKAK